MRHEPKKGSDERKKYLQRKEMKKTKKGMGGNQCFDAHPCMS